MTQLTWDGTGEREYETGVDHGVLYPISNTGTYPVGVPWNGLTTVTESPSGADVTKKYADNIQYLSLVAAEELDGTIEAYTYPDEFASCDGTATPEPGVSVGQQARTVFGLVYRTKVGNDIQGQDYGYKLHLVYGALAAPSEKAFASINDSPDAISFSWKFSTTPVAVSGLKPTAEIVIDSTKVDAGALASLEAELFGSSGGDANLPLPDAVLAFFSGTVTGVKPTQPGFVSGTKVITIPAVTGVNYYIGGVLQTAGPLAAITTDTVVTAAPETGYRFTEPFVDEWIFAAE